MSGQFKQRASATRFTTKGEFEADIATLNVIDADGDTIPLGALRTMENQPPPAAGVPVKISAWNHDSAIGGRVPVGVGWVKEVGDKWVLSGKFFDTPDGQSARVMLGSALEESVNVEWSWAFKVFDAEDDDGGRTLLALGVFEASPVMRAASISTGTTLVKCVGCQSTAMAVKGERLAALLNRLIDAAVTDDRSRADIISAMGSAGGISAGTVSQILNGSIQCPPQSRLSGFARVLGVAVSRLVNAAESDGCDMVRAAAIHEYAEFERFRAGRRQKRRQAIEDAEVFSWEIDSEVRETIRAAKRLALVELGVEIKTRYPPPDWTTHAPGFAPPNLRPVEDVDAMPPRIRAFDSAKCAALGLAGICYFADATVWVDVGHGTDLKELRNTVAHELFHFITLDREDTRFALNETAAKSFGRHVALRA